MSTELDQRAELDQRRRLDPRAASPRAIRRVFLAAQELRECAERYADLTRNFTVRVPCVAEWLIAPRTAEAAARIWGALMEEGVGVRILGGGTNTIPVSPFLSGVTLTLDRLRGVEFSQDHEGELAVKAGTPLQSLCKEAERRTLSGLEGLAGVPGAVAGALIMNAGGRHTSIGDHVLFVDVVEPDGRINVLTREEAGFAYRQSALAGRLVLGARMKLTSAAPEAIQARRLEVARAKRAAQPLGARSAGCFFKNLPDGRSTGRLLDEIGLKGQRVGNASSSTHHANFLINDGRATGADFAALAEQIRVRVRKVCGLELDDEVKLWR